MSDDDSMISDEARFTRQRRNIMVSGSILWALHIAKIDVVSLLPNHANVGSPRNLELLWGVLILYFLWRLYQVSHDARAKRLMHFRQVLPSYLTRILLKTPEIASLRTQIRDHYEPEVGGNIKSVLFRQDQIGLKEFSGGVVRYELEATIDWGNGGITSQRHELIIKEGSWSWWRAALRARWSLTLETTYFTEYTLPYLIGTTAVVLAFYRYWCGT